MRSISCVLSMLAILACTCDQSPTAPSASWPTQAELDRARALNDEYERQLREGAEQLLKAVEHTRRYEALMTKWEEQQQRIDAILDKWDKIGTMLEARLSSEPLPSQAHN